MFCVCFEQEWRKEFLEDGRREDQMTFSLMGETVLPHP